MKWRRALVSRCEPNAAHLMLVEIGSYFDYFWLITQNVDGLHTRAGSKQVLELHGNMRGGRCLRDGVDLPQTPLASLPPYHSCGTALRPHVVQFGETSESATITAAITASAHADLFIVIATSAVVSPARDLPLIALKNGVTVIEINRDPTP
ncbi:NAD-dependent protein deacylase 1 [ANME-1 cluster archaeon GoMg2]|nr:NAD-dependent protein deacylase 1 [ANME-1 cluster archaeon GoMg2]